MSKAEFDEIIDLSAKNFSDQMTLKGWLGRTLEAEGFDLAEVTDEDVSTILIRTILRLYDTYEEEIEYEEDQEYEDQDQEDETEEDDEEEL
jgi:hypothetical protein